MGALVQPYWGTYSNMEKQEIKQKMKELNIKDYSDTLQGICVKCRRVNKCKDKSNICLFKKLVFNLCKPLYKAKLKKE